MSSPGRKVAVIVAGAVVAGAAGWIVGTHVQSPATVAAEHRPPPASPVTARVVRRALTAQVITQSTIGYGQAQPVSLVGTVGTAGTAASDGDGAATSIVTKAPSPNSTVDEGDVLLEVSGRPVFALRGTVPMYRTIAPGASGDDVDQLRAALDRVLDAGLADTGPFDGAVQAAVKRLYRARGYAATAVAGTTPKAPKRVSVASGEILFFPGLPRHLSAVTVAAGAAATGQIATVSSPKVYGYGSLGQDDATLVKVGTAAAMTTGAGRSVAARIVAIGDGAAPPGAGAAARTGDDEAAAAAGIPVKFTIADQAAARSSVGQALRTTIGVGSTSGPVLTVPVSALFTRADGSTRVRVVPAPTTEAAVRDVPVTAGLSVDGTVQVTPAGGGRLQAGDLVLVSSS